MALMGLRLAARSNGVSPLHGATSRKMFNELWPDLTVDEVPIGSITNGVHGRSWTSTRVDAMLSRALGDDWVTAPTDRWSAVRDLDRAEVWDTLVAGRRRAGAASCAAGSAEDVLNPDTLTIGFARRFATYKRATLLLSQPERLIAPAHRRRPSGAVRVRRQGPPRRHAGQGADPADRAVRPQGRRAATGSCSCRTTTWRSPATLYHGCRRVAEHAAPSARGVRHERDEGRAQRCAQLLASSTAGGPSAAPAGGNGWAIESAEDDHDIERRDQRECASLFSLLEERVVPLFYERTTAGVPRGWVEMVLAVVGHARAQGDGVTDGPRLHDGAVRAGGPPVTVDERQERRCRRRARSVARQRPRGVVVGAHHLARRRHQPGRHRRRRGRWSPPSSSTG